ncbi:hypothetical protein NW762_014573 [Fusarium torreyae]|uniref:Uncharacterized protein n=1 Tax=Fusarium torreyae TaxID=1237075 RepID=A0A9W8RM09_9HYPO|nr:hypothetical protein NW762_014573 [Fusarium torreyae]
MEAISAAAPMSIEALKAGGFSHFPPEMRGHLTEQWSSTMAAQSLYNWAFPDTNQSLSTEIEELDGTKYMYAPGTQFTPHTSTSLSPPMSVTGRSNSVSHSTTDSDWGTFMQPVRSMSYQEGSFSAYNTVHEPMMVPGQQLSEGFFEFSDTLNASVNGVVPASQTGPRYNIDPALTLPLDADLLAHHPTPNQPQLDSRYTLTSDLNTYDSVWPH